MFYIGRYNLTLDVCFSVSLESSVMGHDEMLQVMKEKMRLEGQLESLSSEASQVKSVTMASSHTGIFTKY